MGMAPPYGLSPSSISSFKECGLAFKFAYLDRLPQPPSAAASKGTLVHRALELLMLSEPADRTLAHGLACLDRARAELADHPEVAGLDLTADEWDAFHSEADALVRRYFELEDPAAVRPIGLELRLEARVGGARLRGVIDRLELDADGELVVTDYKTGAVPRERFEQRRLLGVNLYALMVRELLGRQPVRVQLLYLSKPEALIAVPTEQSIAGASKRTTALWTAIERACAREQFSPRPSRGCDWCAFKAYCPAWGGDPARAIELRGPGLMIEDQLPLEAVSA